MSEAEGFQRNRKTVEIDSVTRSISKAAASGGASACCG